MTVDLGKGEKITPESAGGGSLRTVRMGFGWQAAPRKGFLSKFFVRKVDLDASAFLYAGKTPFDVVFFQHLTSNDGSVRHGGDNLTGQEGDAQSIVVDLDSVPDAIDQILFTVSSFIGQTFAEVDSAFCRLVDEATGQELARYTLTGGGRHTAHIMAKLHRVSGAWRMTVIGAPCRGRKFTDLLPDLFPYL